MRGANSTVHRSTPAGEVRTSAHFGLESTGTEEVTVESQGSQGTGSENAEQALSRAGLCGDRDSGSGSRVWLVLLQAH